MPKCLLRGLCGQQRYAGHADRGEHLSERGRCRTEARLYAQRRPTDVEKSDRVDRCVRRRHIATRAFNIWRNCEPWRCRRPSSGKENALAPLLRQSASRGHKAIPHGRSTGLCHSLPEVRATSSHACSVRRCPRAWGGPFVIENRVGANGNIGTQAVINAVPDGHTLLFAAAPNTINAALYDNLGFDFVATWRRSRASHVAHLSCWSHPRSRRRQPRSSSRMQKPSGKAQHGIGGQGNPASCRGRVAKNHGRHRHGPCAVPGCRSRGNGFVGRPGRRSL